MYSDWVHTPEIQYDNFNDTQGTKVIKWSNGDWTVVPAPPLPNTPVILIYFQVLFDILQVPWFVMISCYGFQLLVQPPVKQARVGAEVPDTISYSLCPPCPVTLQVLEAWNLQGHPAQPSPVGPGQCLQSSAPRSRNLQFAHGTDSTGRCAQFLTQCCHPSHPDPHWVK